MTSEEEVAGDDDDDEDSVDDDEANMWDDSWFNSDNSEIDKVGYLAMIYR